MDETTGDCASPACEDGSVIELPNAEDTPGRPVTGDCLTNVCDPNTPGPVPDNSDTPTTGCGDCVAGQVVPWDAEGDSCYTDSASTLNVGNCAGGTWTCVDNTRVCEGQVLPSSEKCGLGYNGFDEDCDGEIDEDGTGCACTIGQPQACYNGPQQTAGVGLCHGGMAQCIATGEGNVLGDCVGEVLPATCDLCLITGDEDCNGAETPCTGSHVWSKGLGGNNLDYGGDILELPNGEILVQTTFQGSLTAGTTITSDGGDDIVLVRYDSDGNAMNALAWGGSGHETAGGLARVNGGYVAWGQLGLGSSETFGSPSTLTGVGYDGFLARFDNNGAFVWKKLIGGTGADDVIDVVRMPDDGVVLSGRFQGSINLGGQQLTSAGLDDIFLARFDSAGTHVWSKRFGTSGQDTVRDLAVAPNGNIVMVGELTANIAFGGPTIVAAGGKDGYVATMDGAGGHLWTRAFQSGGDEVATTAQVLSDGSVWVAGSFNTAVNVDGLSGADLTPTATGQDLLLVRYGASGNYIQGITFNGTDTLFAGTSSVGMDDGVIIGGTYSGALILGGNAAPSAGLSDTFLFKISADGALQWSKKSGGTQNDFLNAVKIGECGNIFGTAGFNGSANFGGGSLTSNGGQDIAVLKYRQ
ncbi:MAG: hypothetical protein HOW73_25105 [Polyangiaceae bacterium]|nr:hypothetical protein [Polyangiaceae bacterium]